LEVEFERAELDREVETESAEKTEMAEVQEISEQTAVVAGEVDTKPGSEPQ